MNIYEEQVDNLLNYDSLVVKTDANFLRNPGMEFYVATSNPLASMAENSQPGGTAAQSNQEKYRTFAGKWLISAVRHTVYPSEWRQEDTVCLFRNTKG